MLVGYAARTLNGEEDKYLFPSRTHSFYKSHHLYNLNRVLQLDEKKRYGVIVVEGFFGCLAVVAAGFPCVAIMGTALSETHAELLARYFSHVLLLFDGDEAGKRATDPSLALLGTRMLVLEGSEDALPPVYVRALRLPENMQPDDVQTAELQDMLRFVR